uniref:Uncharacterized protein n=1 Tax=Octopus bimaculoides TaxID=37653 RepID=A0A0L8I0W7_OCTBM
MKLVGKLKYLLPIIYCKQNQSNNLWLYDTDYYNISIIAHPTCHCLHPCILYSTHVPSSNIT